MQSQKPRPKSLARLPLALGICMTLGAFGSCKGIAEVSAWNDPLAITLPKLPAPEDAGTDWEKLEGAWSELETTQTEAYRLRRPASNALAGVNLISSLILMLGAMGTGARLTRGLPTLRAGIALSQAYVIIGLVVGTWIQLGLVETAQASLGPLMDLEGTVGRTALLSVGAYWLGIPLAALAMVGQFGFYLWMQRLLRRPEVADSLLP